MSNRGGYCDVEMHSDCKATNILDCGCRCHRTKFEPITCPQTHGVLFGFTMREDGQVVLMVEDDGFWHPEFSFDPLWLHDLNMAAGMAATHFKSELDKKIQKIKAKANE